MLKLKPALKDYLWGGTKLKTDFGFQSDKDIVAEGWMLSCHKDGESIVENGEYKGKTLSEVIELCGKDVLGKDCEKFDFFPILIKLIDAKKDLSVQVHPDNEYAMRVEGEYGKTECWYILDCDEGAELIYGFNREISSEEFKKRIENNTFLEVVNKVKVHKGDMFFIEAGTLHAIGSGISFKVLMILFISFISFILFFFATSRRTSLPSSLPPFSAEAKMLSLR